MDSIKLIVKKMSDSVKTYYNIMKKNSMTEHRETITQDETWGIDALFSQNNSIENSGDDNLDIAILFNLDDDHNISGKNQSQNGITCDTRNLINGEKELKAQNELNSDLIISIDSETNIDNKAQLNLRQQAQTDLKKFSAKSLTDLEPSKNAHVAFKLELIDPDIKPIRCKMRPLAHNSKD